MISYILALEHLLKFKELCCPKNFMRIKSFHFSIYFPKEFEKIWRKNFFDLDNQWPLVNIDFYIDEIELWEKDYKKTTGQVFAIYKRPIDTLLRYKRSFYSHHCTLLLSAPIRNIHRRSIVWNWNQIDETEQIVNSLQMIASDHVDRLYLTDCLSKFVSKQTLLFMT